MEVTYLLGRWCGVDHQLLFLEFLQKPGWSIEHLAPDLPRIRELMNMYRDLPAAFSDASLVALAERLRCTEVATTEQRDFSVYRPAHIKRLANPISLS
jgi:predicted nucleic acid-binding protein